MKREILFRGQDKRGNWHCGYLHVNTITPEGDKYYINSSYYVENSNFIEVIPETVGQLTDSIDIDGNEIYEGDLVNQKSALFGDEDIDFTGHVVFREGSWLIDNGKDCIPLWSEHRENKIIE